MQISSESTFSNATEVHGPGDYFVSAVDNGQFWLLAGPYETHAEALERVDRVRIIACEHEPKAFFYASGRAGLIPEAGESVP